MKDSHIELIISKANYPKRCFAFTYIGPEKIFEMGNTPEEAVANLWLTLNKK